ncbi:MAG: hypothetical protein FWD94_07945, partial [Treponema sp.]|nr:hypothetical protein [Treponema sp.]
FGVSFTPGGNARCISTVAIDGYPKNSYNVRHEAFVIFCDIYGNFCSFLWDDAAAKGKSGKYSSLGRWLVPVRFYPPLTRHRGRA